MDMNKTGTIKKLQAIYKAMLMGQVLFMGIVIFIKAKGIGTHNAVNEDASRIMQVLAVAISVGCLWAGMHFYRKRIAVIKDSDIPVAEKLKQYQSVSIFKWGLTEVPSFFCVLSYFRTGNWAFLALAIVIVFVFAGYNPTRQKLLQELDITPELLD
jgi:hypothetical protein